MPEHRLHHDVILQCITNYHMHTKHVLNNPAQALRAFKIVKYQNVIPDHLAKF